MTAPMHAPPVLITGAPRSGTSMIAGLFARCGGWSGRCAAGNRDNPLGFFENLNLRNGVNKPLLSAMGYNFRGAGELPPRDADIAVDLQGLVYEHLQSENCPDDARWFFKDAKTSLLWRPWARAFPDATWILVDRPTDDIAESCMSSVVMPEGHTDLWDKDRWLEYVAEYQARLDDIAIAHNCIRINSDRLIYGDFAEIADAIQRVGLEWTDDAEDFVKPRFWRRWDQAPVEIESHPIKAKKKFEKGDGHMNTSAARIVEHVEANIRRPLPQVRPYPARQQIGVIACGGPSLADDWGDLKALVDGGAKLCTVNGAHNYCVERGLIPSIHTQVDARPFNTRFVQPPQEKTLYCLASQCHPSVFDALDDHKVAIYHCETGSGEKEVLDEYYFKRWSFVEGGSTVALRALSLMRILGFRKIEMFGFDSCHMGGRQHAYDQPENLDRKDQAVVVGGREFLCDGWMAEQAVDFMGLMKARAMLYDDIKVHGDGLIAALIQHGHDQHLNRDNGEDYGLRSDAA